MVPLIGLEQGTYCWSQASCSSSRCELAECKFKEERIGCSPVSLSLIIGISSIEDAACPDSCASGLMLALKRPQQPGDKFWVAS